MKSNATPPGPPFLRGGSIRGCASGSRVHRPRESLTRDRTRYTGVWLLAASWCAAAAAACRADGEAASTVNLESVVQAWKAREARAGTAYFEWRPDGSGVHDPGRFATAGQAQADAKPGQPVASLRLAPGRLRYDGERWSYRAGAEFAEFLPRNDSSALDRLRTQLDYNLRLGKTDFAAALESQPRIPQEAWRRPQRFTCVSDGETYREFFEGAGRLVPISMAIPAADYEAVNTLDYRPLLFALRPLGPQFGSFHPDECRLGAETSFVNGVQCVLVQETRAAGGTSACWIDPQREFAVVRCVESQNGTTVAQFDIRYELDPEHGWVPSSWTTLYPAQKPSFRHASATVTKYRINEPADPKAFEVSLPAATLLIHAAKERIYTVDDQGVQHVVATPDEMRSLLGRETFETQTWRLSATQWGLIGVGTVCLVLALLKKLRVRLGQQCEVSTVDSEDRR